MNKPSRKSKMSMYEVLVTRVVKQTVKVFVDARSVELAEEVALAAADGLEPEDWTTPSSMDIGEEFMGLGLKAEGKLARREKLA